MASSAQAATPTRSSSSSAKTSTSKPDRLTLEAAARLVPDGASVGLGGAWLSCHPMALVRELIRRRARRLRLVTVTGSVDVDSLVGAGCVRSVVFSFVSLEAFGLAPSFRRAAERGEIELEEMTGVGVLVGLEAASRGVPFLPYRGPAGIDLVDRSPAYGVIRCPFTGEELTAVRAIPLDVALVHGALADTDGNVQLLGSHGPDSHLCEAAELVIASVEEVVDPDRLREHPERTVIPRHRVRAIVEAPWGAHPTSNLPYYVTDMWAIRDYARVSSEGSIDSWAAADEGSYARAVDPRHYDRLRVLAR